MEKDKRTVLSFFTTFLLSGKKDSKEKFWEYRFFVSSSCTSCSAPIKKMELHKGKANEKIGGFLNKKKRGLTKKKTV